MVVSGIGRLGCVSAVPSREAATILIGGSPNRFPVATQPSNDERDRGKEDGI